MYFSSSPQGGFQDREVKLRSEACGYSADQSPDERMQDPVWKVSGDGRMRLSHALTLVLLEPGRALAVTKFGDGEAGRWHWDNPCAEALRATS